MEVTMTIKTKCGVITSVEHAEIVMRTLPDLQDDELLIKVEACNICTADYGLWTGARAGKEKLPFAGGHECVGLVVAKGTGVSSNLNVKDRVGVMSVSGCGKCRPCLSGNTRNCICGSGEKQASFDGYYGDFGMSQYVVKKESLLMKMNKYIPASEAAFLEPVSTVIYGLRRFHLEVGDNVVVIGGGTMGILNALAAKAMGARVIVSEVMESKLNTARELGLKVIDGMKVDPVQAVKDMTDGIGADKVVIAVGLNIANKQALEMVKDGGDVLFFAAGYPAPALDISSSNMIHYKRIGLIGTVGADVKDWVLAAKLLGMKAINVSPLLQKVYRLDEIQEAYKLAATPGTYRISLHME
jgi:L-iditol 2-dehydrogenase